MSQGRGLPEDVVAATQALIAAVNGLALVADDYVSEEQMQQLGTQIQHLDVVKEYVQSLNGGTIMVLADGAFLMAFLKLLVAVCRCWGATNLLIATCDLAVELVARDTGGYTFALCVVHTDVMKCFSRQLSILMPPSSAPATTPQQPRGSSGVEADPVPALAHTLEQRAAALACMLRLLTYLAYTVDDQSAYLASTRPAETEAQQLYTWEFMHALRDSAVLEHAARLLLTLVLAPDAGTAPGTHGLAEALYHLAITCQYLTPFHITISKDSGAPILSCLWEVLSGPCVKHALLVGGVVELCAVDGGPAYGLPLLLLTRMPLPADTGENPKLMQNVRGRLGLHALDDAVMERMVWAIGAPGTDSRPPYSPRRRLSLLLRAGRVAVASAQMWTEEEEEATTRAVLSGGAGAGGIAHSAQVASLQASSQAGGEGGDEAAGRADSLQADGSSDKPGAPPPRLALRPEAVAYLFCDAVTGARAVLPILRGRECWEEAEVAWWGLVAEGVKHVLPWATPEWADAMAALLHGAKLGGLLTGGEHEDPLPPAPPPDVAAALASGMLPCLERLLRRANAHPEGPESDLVQALFTTSAEESWIWRYLGVLLAYGDPRQAAALVVTLGKPLWGAKPALMLHWTGPGGDGSGDTVGSGSQQQTECEGGGGGGKPPAAARVVFSCVAAVTSLLNNGLDYLVSAQGVPNAGGALTPPQLQLARMLSFAACRCLPVLSHSVQQAWLAMFDHPEQVWFTDTLLSRLGAFLKWLPQLVARSWAEEQAHSSASGGSDSGSGNTTDDGASGSGSSGSASKASRSGSSSGIGLRQLLLEDVGVIALLGAALQILAAIKTALADSSLHGWLLGSLLHSLLLVAEAFPRETRLAALPCGGGVVGDATSVGTAPVRASPRRPWWLPSLVRALLPTARAHSVERELAVEALARKLEQWHLAATTGQAGSEPPLPPLQHTFEAFHARGLAGRVEACSLLRTCANPRCANLAGDSEADLPLRACAGCGVGYCCRTCQTAHWRAGHRAMCAGQHRQQQPV